MDPYYARHHSGLAALVLLLGVGCTASHYRRSADQESYRAIAAKSRGVANLPSQFSIDQTNVISLESFPLSTNVEAVLGLEKESDLHARVLTLDDALDMAFNHSRIYQSTKEGVYLTALTLTLARHQFAPIFFGRGRADYQVQTEEVRIGIDALAGQPRVLAAQDAQLIEQHRVTGHGETGVNLLLRTGARLSAAFTTDFLRFLTGDPRTFTASQVSATLVQPLWRGAGYKVTMENLTQAERNLLYRLRDFANFRRTFSVQIATAYYRVLQSRDQVKNSYFSLLSFQKSAERARAFAKEGRTKQADLSRLEQEELSSEGAWINAIRSYKESLDNFKLQLGLSIDSRIVLDDAELERLKIIHPALTAEDAITVALNLRQDLKNVRDQYDDSSRKILVAKDSLKAQLDLVAGAGVNSKPETGTGFPLPQLDRYHWNAGLDVDLPFDRKAQRNAYRATLIAYAQAARDLERSEDEIKLQVRGDWRALDEAKRTYEISELGVRLSEKRVEEQNLLAELGRANSEFQVAAQTALTASRNARTAALVGHTVARLQFWRDMGILSIKENGQWEDVPDAQTRQR